MTFKLGEVGDEHINQLLGLRIIGSGICPGAARVENAWIYAFNRNRNQEAEIRVNPEFGIIQRTIKSSGQKSASCLDRHTLAGSIGAARPAGRYQPAADAVFGDLVAQQVAVFRWMTRHEWCAKAGREGCFWLSHALFGARYLGCVAGQEVIHGLFRCQLGNRWQYAECIGRQHDDRAWMA